METIRRDIPLLEKDFDNCPGSIKNYKQQLNNPKLTPEKRNSTMDQLNNRIETCNELPSRIKELQNELPHPIWTAKNTRHHRILKKAHTWKWIYKNKQDDVDVKEIATYLKKFYDRKSDTYKKEKTFEDYIDLFCYAMGEVEEDVSNREVHLLKRFPIKEGYEFKSLRIFGNKNLDEFTTILINAVGLYYFVEGEDESDYNVPNSVTEKV